MSAMKLARKQARSISVADSAFLRRVRCRFGFQALSVYGVVHCEARKVQLAAAVLRLLCAVQELSRPSSADRRGNHRLLHACQFQHLTWGGIPRLQSAGSRQQWKSHHRLQIRRSPRRRPSVLGRSGKLWQDVAMQVGVGGNHLPGELGSARAALSSHSMGVNDADQGY